MDSLRAMGALDPENSTLTPLGYHLANLPVGAKLGKLLLYGCLFRCIEPILTIAAAMSCKNPFVSNVTTRKEAKLQKLQFLQGSSDLLTIARAYEAWSSVPKSDHRQRRDLCRDYFLSETSLRMISEMRKQFRKQLKDIGFLTSQKSGTWSSLEE